MAGSNQNYDAILDDLFRVVLSLDNIEECRAFFRDLFTMQELINFSQRLQVASLLMEGKTYETIRREVSVSSATITRINTALQFGTGGYRKQLSRIAAGKTAAGGIEAGRTIPDKAGAAPEAVSAGEDNM